ncbi:MAG: hypothetical protein U1B78_02380, partial [Dehalococcoidia bacterium]|nr:hypothetical protein [Dehalococcoidia bacterium]
MDSSPVGQALRQVPGARWLAHSLRSAWDHVRPFPLPRYDAATPRVGAGEPLEPFLPPNESTLASSAMSEESAGFVD